MRAVVGWCRYWKRRSPFTESGTAVSISLEPFGTVVWRLLADSPEHGILAPSSGAFAVALAVIVLLAVVCLATRFAGRGRAMAHARRVSLDARAHPILTTMADGVVTIDDAGMISSANPAAERMFGAASGALDGKAFATFVPAFSRDELRRMAGAEHQAPALGARRELQGQRTEGAEFPLELVIAEISLPGRTLFGGVVRDISNRIEAERRLRRQVEELESARSALQEQAEQLAVARDRAEQGARAKSEFLATMSHELRTPMNGVLGMAQLLTHTPLTAEQAARVNMLRKSGESLLRIINDVLDFSKIEAGKLSIESQPFDLPALLEEVRETLAAAADVVGLILSVEVDPRCPRVAMGDAGRIRQVLLNLVGNAIKFTDRGYVRITAAASDESKEPVIRLNVDDTGIGIAPQALARLFLPFTQGDGSTTRKHGGTGLGLVISRRLAEMMGGSLTVSSTLGEGSSFSVALPLPAAPSKGRSALTPISLPRLAPLDGGVATVPPRACESRSVRVLVAEDNAINQVVAVSLLAHLGCTVDVAADGREAVRRWSEGSYDLILMDCQMPDMDGFEATRLIRAAEGDGTHIPIVALTANAMADDRSACIDVGMDDHIAKPVTEEALVSALARARRG